MSNGGAPSFEAIGEVIGEVVGEFVDATSDSFRFQRAANQAPAVTSVSAATAATRRHGIAREPTVVRGSDAMRRSTSRTLRSTSTFSSGGSAKRSRASSM